MLVIFLFLIYLCFVKVWGRCIVLSKSLLVIFNIDKIIMKDNKCLILGLKIMLVV